ncbi:hypothetical protein GCM10011352_00800 [Marinobacterium zhoushanense]|uniref:Uncharacterized protein n=1 Tax=Marinobacterium zhoushanense TaxID=1679163 RepID=A0ABQ1JV42_9GAMM|nr:hypothetical protein [Marinobacterium zhoushanense]GGB79005.1 hypothetical protein GCM10011352_00800 [Marinobacterium zhoushanense]
MDERHIEFLSKEMESRREDIQARVLRVENDMRYGLLSIGGLWAWLLTHNTGQESGIYRLDLAVWLPLLLALFFMAKWIVQDQRIRGISLYIERVEMLLQLPEGAGWESNRHLYSRNGLAWVTHGFWTLLIILNLAVACYLS